MMSHMYSRYRNTLYVYLTLLVLLPLMIGSCKNSTPTTNKSPLGQRAEYAIVIHGGAGVMDKTKMSADLIARYEAALSAALDVGEGILKKGGTAIDAVEQTIRLMEDDSLFNAGRGAVFASDGHNSLDASIMVGANKDAGAVAGVSIIRHPISAARAVMEQSPHVMMSGAGADSFATMMDLEVVTPSYFYNHGRWNSLQRAKAREAKQLQKEKTAKYGTVGCVALDKYGHIVAGTSTGGMTNKKYDRIGDSPVIGAGTFADDATCGVSATGHGEYFIRHTVARDIAAMMQYGNKTLSEAADYIIHDVLVSAGGDGGVVALDRFGNIAMPFNTSGMYRGYRKPGEQSVQIFK